MSSLKVISTLVLLIGMAVGGFGQVTPVEKINQFFAAKAKADEFSGNVLIAKDGNILYNRSFGLADKVNGIPNNSQTTFNIGSIGKLFTSMAILQLAQAGKLQLTDELGKYLPDFPDDKRAITIHQLLLHTSGLANYMDHPDYLKNRNRFRAIADFLPMIEGETLLCAPCERPEYSNSGYIVLGAIVERVSGMKYVAYIQEHIWKPAGMVNTGLYYQEDTIENRAIGYTRQASGQLVDNSAVLPPAASDGGACSTVEDLLRFDLGIQKGLFLNEEYQKLWLTPRLGPMTYGPATVPADRSFSGKPAYGAMGGCLGASAALHHVTGDNYTIVVLSNYEEVGLRSAIDIEAMLYGKK